jgi:hypothetical protein
VLVSALAVPSLESLFMRVSANDAISLIRRSFLDLPCHPAHHPRHTRTSPSSPPFVSLSSPFLLLRPYIPGGVNARMSNVTMLRLSMSYQCDADRNESTHTPCSLAASCHTRVPSRRSGLPMSRDSGWFLELTTSLLLSAGNSD